MSDTEIARYDTERFYSERMVAPDKLTPDSLIPQMRVHLRGLRGTFASVITLINRGKINRALCVQEDGPYEMNNWGPLFEDALARLNPAHASQEDLTRVVNESIAAVIAALTLRSNEGIERAEASPGWSRFSKDNQSWAARWDGADGRREYMLGERRAGLVGGYVEIAPRGQKEAISRLALGEMDLDANGEFTLKSGAMIDVRDQYGTSYSGAFVTDGQERTWEGRNRALLS